MKLPKSISPCPIVEAVFESRFQTDAPEEAVVGMVYQALREEFPKMSALPLASLPQQMRKADRELTYQPLHRLEGERMVLLIGPRNFAIASKGDYLGWQKYRADALRVFETVAATGIFQKVERFGLRYISFFEGDVLSNLTLSVQLQEKEIQGSESFFRTILQWEGCSCHLQVGKDLKLSNRDDKAGSVLDIDAFATLPTPSGSLLDDAEVFLETAHHAEKDLFFTLLKPEFLATLSPTYEASTT
jgi:uncharacterized protein (TIGR04255 family)